MLLYINILTKSNLKLRCTLCDVTDSTLLFSQARFCEGLTLSDGVKCKPALLEILKMEGEGEEQQQTKEEGQESMGEVREGKVKADAQKQKSKTNEDKHEGACQLKPGAG